MKITTIKGFKIHTLIKQSFKPVVFSTVCPITVFKSTVLNVENQFAVFGKDVIAARQLDDIFSGSP